MWTQIPLGHGNLQDGKDNHEVPGVLLSIKVGDESGQEVVIIVVQILESFAIVPEQQVQKLKDCETLALQLMIPQSLRVTHEAIQVLVACLTV